MRQRRRADTWAGWWAGSARQAVAVAGHSRVVLAAHASAAVL